MEKADEVLTFVSSLRVARARAMDCGSKKPVLPARLRASAFPHFLHNFTPVPRCRRLRKEYITRSKATNFNYDGESHTINGYPRDSAAARSLKLSQQSVVAYLKAQRIFWGLSFPESSITIYKHGMLEELQDFCCQYSNGRKVPQPVWTRMPHEDHGKPRSYRR